jgi:hypothetical protein
MSWLFSQALVEAYLGDIYLDGEQSVQSSGNNIQQAYCALDKMTDFCRISQFGMMFKPLTESLGEELLMSYLGDFHARTLAQPEGGGITGSRSSMWKHMARIIGEVRPKYAFIENSPMLTIRGLESVLADLASMGFDAEWGVLGADFIGLPHRRERIWVLASDTSNKYVERCSKQEILGKPRLQSIIYDRVDKNEQGLRSILSSGLCRTFNGLPGQVDRIKAIGNAQVPRVAAVAWRLLKERLDGHKQRGMEKHLRS